MVNSQWSIVISHLRFSMPSGLQKRMRYFQRIRSVLLVALIVGIVCTNARAQQAQQFQILPIRNNLYMLTGAGANIALSVGPDGVLMVDTGTAANSDRLLAAVRQLQQQVATNGLQAWNYAAETRSSLPRMISPPAPAKPIRYIINTSMDADHTGGNEKRLLPRYGDDHS
jgi:glyoxylase-like metal-dependent hydrolase (beta-lactamase superfamily II)